MAVCLLAKGHDFFVGIDLDGCVFDLMEAQRLGKESGEDGKRKGI